MAYVGSIFLLIWGGGGGQNCFHTGLALTRIDSVIGSADSSYFVLFCRVLPSFCLFFCQGFLDVWPVQGCAVSYKTRVFNSRPAFGNSFVAPALPPLEPVFWEGDATKRFPVKKGFFSDKEGGNSVNEGFVKAFYRKGNSVKRSGPFSAPPDSEN